MKTRDHTCFPCQTSIRCESTYPHGLLHAQPLFAGLSSDLLNGTEQTTMQAWCTIIFHGLPAVATCLLKETSHKAVYVPIKPASAFHSRLYILTSNQFLTCFFIPFITPSSLTQHLPILYSIHCDHRQSNRQCRTLVHPTQSTWTTSTTSPLPRCVPILWVGSMI